MRFLIAGFGSIGRRHFRNLLALGEYDIVFLRSHRSTLPDEEIADFPVETDLTTALAYKPDAVIISNPTAFHLNIAIPAAEMGCHLFIEKPISHSLEGVDQLRSAVANGGGKVFTAFQFRFHPGLQYIQKLIDGRSPIGYPLSVRAHWGEYLPDWHPWEDYRQGYSARPELGGGVILTLCHPLDYLRWILGEVNALWAFTSNQSDLHLQVEDTAEIGLRFENGAIGSVQLNYTQQPPSHNLEIVGTKGTIRWDNADGNVRVFGAEVGEWETISAPESFERNDLFISEMRHFLQIIRGKAKSLSDLDDGIASLRLAVSALESARTGRRIEII
jgi:predicted dehydrogenase